MENNIFHIRRNMNCKIGYLCDTNKKYLIIIITIIVDIEILNMNAVLPLIYFMGKMKPIELPML